MPTAEEIAEFQLESDSDDDCMPGGGTWGQYVYPVSACFF